MKIIRDSEHSILRGMSSGDDPNLMQLTNASDPFDYHSCKTTELEIKRQKIQIVETHNDIFHYTMIQRPTRARHWYHCSIKLVPRALAVLEGIDA